MSISQTYNDGVIRIYNVTDAAEKGRQPVPELTLAETLYYAELKLGITRYYTAKQNQSEVKRVVRVPARQSLHTGQTAITEDGEQYHVDLVQLAYGVYPKSFDLTLGEMKQRFDIPGGEET